MSRLTERANGEAVQLTPEEFGQRLLQLNPAAVSHPRDVDALIDAVLPVDHAKLLPHIFAFFEAYPENEIGAPGSLVHFAEHFDPAYQEVLLTSLERQPSHFAVLMVNRILNSELPAQERVKYTALLTHAACDQRAPESVRQFAQRLLERQRKIRGHG